MGILDYKYQGISLCAKRIVRAMWGNEYRKVLIRYFISTSLPLNCQA